MQKGFSIGILHRDCSCKPFSIGIAAVSGGCGPISRAGATANAWPMSSFSTTVASPAAAQLDQDSALVYVATIVCVAFMDHHQW